MMSLSAALKNESIFTLFEVKLQITNVCRKRRFFFENSCIIQKYRLIVLRKSLFTVKFDNIFMHCLQSAVLSLSGMSVPHCYSIRSNLKKMDPLQFCLPVFLRIHQNPKQKEFLNSCEGFLR